MLISKPDVGCVFLPLQCSEAVEGPVIVWIGFGNALANCFPKGTFWVILVLMTLAISFFGQSKRALGQEPPLHGERWGRGLHDLNFDGALALPPKTGSPSCSWIEPTGKSLPIEPREPPLLEFGIGRPIRSKWELK